jgi:hypothetical protein
LQKHQRHFPIAKSQTTGGALVTSFELNFEHGPSISLGKGRRLILWGGVPLEGASPQS